MNVSIIDGVEFRREQYGLKKRAWAEKLGMQASHYSEFIHGKRELPKSAMALAFHYGVPACVLFQCEQDGLIDG